MLQNLCTPALIYLIFSITQITIDIFKKDYNVALVKFSVAFIFTILLNYLCSSGLGIVSWIIVFIPFILMSVIVTYILTFFGIDPKTNDIRILKNGEELVDNDKKEEKNNESPPALSNVSATYSEGDNKIIINYTSSKEGKVWCKAILKSEGKTPTINELKEKTSKTMMFGEGNECYIYDIGDDKTYDVYMYVEDSNSIGIDTNSMLETKKEVTTTETTTTTSSQPASSGDSGAGESGASGDGTSSFSLLSDSYPSIKNKSNVSGLQNSGITYSNFFQNTSNVYKERKKHIHHINNILIGMNEMDNSSYFMVQAEACANKSTDVKYEKCMKRLLQAVYSRIKTTENQKQLLYLLKNGKINVTGITGKLI